MLRVSTIADRLSSSGDKKRRPSPDGYQVFGILPSCDTRREAQPQTLEVSSPGIALGSRGHTREQPLDAKKGTGRRVRCPSCSPAPPTGEIRYFRSWVQIGN